MRTLCIVSFSVAVVAISAAGLAGRPAADDSRQPSIMIDRLTANAKNLPVQSFDAF